MYGVDQVLSIEVGKKGNRIQPTETIVEEYSNGNCLY